MPLEGGLYQWAKLGFNDLTGFLVAWNLWIYAVVLISEIGLIATTNIAYALGSDFLWIAGNRWMIALTNLLLIGGMTLVSILGLTVGKWVHNVGAILLMTLFGGMLVFVAIHAARGGHAAFPPLSVGVPAISLLSVNILGKLASPHSADSSTSRSSPANVRTLSVPSPVPSGSPPRSSP
jgi:amino acid transporter